MMTPSFIMNSSPSAFHVEPNEDHDHHHQFFVSNHQLASSSSYSYEFYFNSTRDQTRYYPSEVYNPQQQLEDGGSYEVIKNKVDNNGLKLSLGNGDQEALKNNQVMKCISSKKMRLKIEDHHQKQKHSSKLETDNYSSSNNNSSSNNCNTTPIRVCSDCNTTKTPLWRSGPKGPKSLCNACGIRQRKARRAMAAAAAAAAANGTPFATEITPTVKIKMNHNKEKTKNNYPQTVPFKKRCKLAINGNNNNAATTSSSIISQAQEPEKLGQGGFEDFLINLSNKLAFHHVFPQDEKEAAILLMAISSGLVHG